MYSLTFAAPYILWAFVSLPFLWWLLRLTPPKPQTEPFPPLRLLQALPASETQAAKSPWWLTLLRLLIAALLILAFARPIQQNLDTVSISSQKPLVLMLDNNWAAYPNKKRFLKQANSLIDQAEEKNISVYLLPTTISGTYNMGPFTSTEARRQLSKLRFSVSPTQRQHVFEKLKQLDQENQANGLTVSYLTNGLATGQDNKATKSLQSLGKNSVFHWYQPNYKPIIGIQSADNKANGLNFSLIRTDEDKQQRQGLLQAFDAKAQLLGEVNYNFKNDETELNGILSLPPAILNDIAYLRLKNIDNSSISQAPISAAGTWLMDTNNKQKTVAMLAQPQNQLQQPLLSPQFYVSKALEGAPNIAGGKILQAENSINEQSVESLLNAHPSLLILSDNANLTREMQNKISQWVKNGGTLLRFAGPSFARNNSRDIWQQNKTKNSNQTITESNDDTAYMTQSLLPVPTRAGIRNFGGALSWEKSQKIAPFKDNSPFYGLKAPEDIKISQQILAEPSTNLVDKSWISLTDGTPLVSSAQLGNGRLIFVHTGLDNNWSNLALSGFFVEMLNRFVDLSGATNQQSQNPIANQILAPYQILADNGHLEAASSGIRSLDLTKKTTPQPSYDTPAGFYGQHNRLYSLNLLNKNSQLSYLKTPSFKNVQIETYKNGSKEWQNGLLIAATLLFILDILISLILKTGRVNIKQCLMRLFKTNRTKTHNSAFKTKAYNNKKHFLLLFVAISLSALFIPQHKTYAAAQQNKQQSEQTRKQLNDKKDIQNDNKLKGPDGQNLDIAKAVAMAGSTHLAYVKTGNKEIDTISKTGLDNLSRYIKRRTTVEPDTAVGLDLNHDELAFYPLIYWPIDANTNMPTQEALQNINHYMQHGGTVLFDTRDAMQDNFKLDENEISPNTSCLRAILSKLNVPPLIAAPKDHVIARSFYLMPDFPGRMRNSPLWIAASSDSRQGQNSPIRAGDGISPILITANDFASAWADDGQGGFRFALIPDGEKQRVWAFRGGVNIVMYVLTGNYKADQVSAPELLKRLGN